MAVIINGVNDIQKIDSMPVNGLLGVSNSLAYKVHEIEKHEHSAGSWFETATTTSGEDHVADRVGLGGGAFQIDSGNATWGSWLQILGPDDTPARTGQVYFDPHEMVVSDVERAGTYFVQIARGTTGAAGLSAGTYTEFVYYAGTNRFSGILSIQTGRSPIDVKLWARCMCPDFDTGTMDFYIGTHEYVG